MRYEDDERPEILDAMEAALAEAFEAGKKAAESSREVTGMLHPTTQPGRERLADELGRVWAILRCVSPNEAYVAYSKHDIDSTDAPGFLADQILEVQKILRAENSFAMALLGLWQAEGGECGHGVGLADDCEGEARDDGEGYDECHWQEFRPALRAALEAIRDPEILSAEGTRAAGW